MADIGAIRVAMIGMYLVCSFFYIMYLLCDAAELWDRDEGGKSAMRIFSYVNLAAVASITMLICAAFFSSGVCRILFLVFNAIFVLCMAIFIGLIYADKMGDGGPNSSSMKQHHFHAICCFSFMFIAAILEMLVLMSN